MHFDGLHYVFLLQESIFSTIHLYSFLQDLRTFFARSRLVYMLCSGKPLKEAVQICLLLIQTFLKLLMTSPILCFSGLISYEVAVARNGISPLPPELCFAQVRSLLHSVGCGSSALQCLYILFPCLQINPRSFVTLLRAATPSNTVSRVCTL